MTGPKNGLVEDGHEMHEKFEYRTLKTQIRNSESGRISVTAQPTGGEQYAKAHRISGGERIELFAIRKGDNARTRFWLDMYPDQAEAFARQILREVELAREDDDE